MHVRATTAGGTETAREGGRVGGSAATAVAAAAAAAAAAADDDDDDDDDGKEGESILGEWAGLAPRRLVLIRSPVKK
jgi:hypothetical protein